MRYLAKILLAIVAIFVFSASAQEVVITRELQAAMRDIATHSEVVTVVASGATPGTFREDADPTTLQIVMLDKPSDGDAQVSSDGEVIFLQKDTSEQTQQALFEKAFYLKARAREAGPQSVKMNGSP